MSAPDEPGRAPQRRRRTWLAVVAVLVLAALGGTWLASQGIADPARIAQALGAGEQGREAAENGSEPEAPESEAPSSADALVPETPVAVTQSDPALAAAAEEAVTAALSVVVSNETPVLSPEVSEDLAQTVGGAMRAEIEAHLLELEANEWTQRGTPTIENVQLVSADNPTSPSAVTVQACVDSSNVVYVRRDGTELPRSSTPRASNIFTLSLEGGVWRVVSRTFPDNPTC